jgi:hypothetical protein
MSSSIEGVLTGVSLLPHTLPDPEPLSRVLRIDLRGEPESPAFCSFVDGELACTIGSDVRGTFLEGDVQRFKDGTEVTHALTVIRFWELRYGSLHHQSLRSTVKRIRKRLEWLCEIMNENHDREKEKLWVPGQSEACFKHRFQRAMSPRTTSPVYLRIDHNGCLKANGDRILLVTYLWPTFPEQFVVRHWCLHDNKRDVFTFDVWTSEIDHIGTRMTFTGIFEDSHWVSMYECRLVYRGRFEGNGSRDYFVYRDGGSVGTAGSFPLGQFFNQPRSLPSLAASSSST